MGGELPARRSRSLHWERGLKRELVAAVDEVDQVAPFIGSVD